MRLRNRPTEDGIWIKVNEMQHGLCETRKERKHLQLNMQKTLQTNKL